MQPREWQPRPGTVTLRNSVEILTNLYTYHSQPGGRKKGGENCHTNAQFGAGNAQPTRAGTCHLELSEDPYVK